MGYTGKLLKNKIQKQQKTFCKKSCSEKAVSKIVSMGYTRKLIRNNTQKQKKTFYKKSCSEKTVSKIVSMGNTGKLLKKPEKQILPVKKISTKNYPNDRINDSTQEWY